MYDKTRAGLLRGRNTMLAMSAEHLRVIRAQRPHKRLVWVDIGGGTGTSGTLFTSGKIAQTRLQAGTLKL